MLRCMSADMSHSLLIYVTKPIHLRFFESLKLLIPGHNPWVRRKSTQKGPKGADIKQHLPLDISVVRQQRPLISEP